MITNLCRVREKLFLHLIGLKEYVCLGLVARLFQPVREFKTKVHTRVFFRKLFDLKLNVVH